LSTPARVGPGLAASLAAALLALQPLACGLGGLSPTVFAPGQEIPLGELSLTVTGWEAVPPGHAPISALRAAPGEKVIAVFVRWSGLPGRSDMERRVLLERFLERQARIVDDEGFQTTAFSAMARELYRLQAPVREAPSDWVVVFHVWIDSRNYKLLLAHPDPAQGGLRLAEVQLR